jgi:ABC-type amino acid transport system permease subunit
MSYDWNFSVLLDPQYRGLLAAGLRTTLSLTFWCVVLGTPLGVLLGFLAYLDRMIPALPTGSGEASRRQAAYRLAAARTLRSLMLTLSRLSMVLIDVVRAIPLLLLILTSYYVLPILARDLLNLAGFLTRPDHGQTDVSSYSCVVVAMALNLAAFVGELVRGAAVATSRGDILAARSLGMGQFLTFRRIVLPQVFREILPGLATLYITMLKMSTLASTVAVYEILHSADAVIQRTYRPLELYVTVCGVFLALVIPLAYGARRLERSRAFLRRS